MDASGFVWERAEQVVTALHVVAGCRLVTVYSNQTRSISAASIAKVLTEADLALLRLDTPFSVAPLQSARTEPALQTELAALGYQLAAPTPSSTTLRVAYGSGRLRDVLPDAARRQVQQAGMPSLSLPILRLEGHLVPGLSGSPIVDGSGRVAAVGDGGLEGGAASISWALPVRHVGRLSASTESLGSRAVEARALFAAEVDARPATEAIPCGQMAFRKMRTRSYAQLAGTTDDPMSEQFLRQMFQVAQVDPARFSFDIYVNEASGATVAVPEGLALRTSAAGCTGTFFDGGLVLHVGGTVGQDVVQASLEFEQDAAGTTRVWTADLVGSYGGPQQRWDGLVVNRKGFYGTDPSDPAAMFGMAQPTTYYFETLAARGEAFMGVAAVHNNYSDISVQNLTSCQFQVSPTCRRGMDQFDEWAHLVMAAFLSSFPIG